MTETQALSERTPTSEGAGRRRRRVWGLCGAIAAGALLVAGCSDGGSDPADPGTKTEIDGGEAGTTGGGGSSTTEMGTGGGTTGGGTAGNQIAPGDTTQQTADGTQIPGGG